ncbi:MAG: SMP-30/gluconolactonase/LRE family protein, partial [Acetobacteraceae bacterium]
LAGGMDYEEREPLAGLWRLDPDLRVTRLDDGIIVANGPCWSPDGTIFYFADTGRRVIWSCHYDQASGNLLSRRIFASFEHPLRGFPDGATVDAEGFVWSVEVYGGRLVRFAPDGTIDRLIGMPADSITSLTFGGADLDIAYVTSMARPYQGRRRLERVAGGLFAVHGIGVRGLPEPRFAG